MIGTNQQPPLKGNENYEDGGKQYSQLKALLHFTDTDHLRFLFLQMVDSTRKRSSMGRCETSFSTFPRRRQFWRSNRASRSSESYREEHSTTSKVHPDCQISLILCLDQNDNRNSSCATSSLPLLLFHLFLIHALLLALISCIFVRFPLLIRLIYSQTSWFYLLLS